MFKKFVLILVFLFILTGCNIYVINYDSVNSIIETVLYKEKEITNSSFEGYSFYLPQGNKIIDKNDYNIKIKDNRYYYYLYVDTIAYHYKVTNNVELDSNHFYTMKLDNTKTVGYIDITEYNDKYFIVLMYNYAKMECFVNKEDLNDTLVNICSILSSVKFNDKIISAYVDSNKEISQEESFDIFSSKRENDNFLKYEQEYGTYYDKSNSNKKNDEDIIDLQTNN